MNSHLFYLFILLNSILLGNNTSKIFSVQKANENILIDGKIDPIKGIMMRKFKLIGNMAKVMRATKAAQELVNSTTAVDTEYY